MADGWLDMSRYPDLDPDQALPPPGLGRLIEIRLGHKLGPLPEFSWEPRTGDC
jgi:hypothetical protein